MFSHQNFILNLVFAELTPLCESASGLIQYINMAEKQPDVVQINDDDDNLLQQKGPTNQCLAEEYAHTLDETMAEFKELVREDQKDKFSH